MSGTTIEDSPEPDRDVRPVHAICCWPEAIPIIDLPTGGRTGWYYFSCRSTVFFLKELLLLPGSTEFKPMLSIVCAFAFRTLTAAGFGHPSGKDKASARNGKTGRFIGVFGQKTSLPEPLCATDRKLRPLANRGLAC